MQHLQSFKSATKLIPSSSQPPIHAHQPPKPLRHPANRAELLGDEARVILFGSRTDDDGRGGDIDLLVDLSDIDEDKQRKSRTFIASSQRHLRGQPTDLLVADPSTPELPIYQVAGETGVAL